MPPLQIHFSASKYCESWIGTFYKWGGDDPSGFDCSGIIHEVLQAFGYEYRGFDSTAHDLYLRFKENKVEGNGFLGCLVFWLTNGIATHVEMITEILDDLVLTTGASGGGSKTGSRTLPPGEDIYKGIEPQGIYAHEFLPPVIKAIRDLLLSSMRETDAIKHNAYIKKNVITYRGSNYEVVDPFLPGKE